MKLYPNWKGSLALFAALILLMVANFFWQGKRINKSFVEHSLEHSRILGAVVELNIRNSLMNHTGMETIIGSSLKNSARFISNLNQIEPFSPNELAAFAAESGLKGVRVVWSDTNRSVSGPDGWLPSGYLPQKGTLQFLPDANLYVFSYATGLIKPQPDFVVVGMSSEEAESIQEKMSVETLLGILRKMDGIEYVRFEKPETPGQSILPSEPELIWFDGRPVSESRMIIGDRELTVGLEADYFSGRMESLKKELIVFLTGLIIFGSLCTWWLYRIQQNRLEQTRRFERKMARQLEQASLGRAAATITHEMRNPLNAISIGLQRLQIEADSLDDEHAALVASMRDAVERSNSVLIHLQKYVNPVKFEFTGVLVKDLLEGLIVLYKPQCETLSIKLEVSLTENMTIQGDNSYLSQAVENLIKNAIEAQPEGGLIRIKTFSEGNDCVICFENCWKGLSPAENRMLLEPYFTTKAYGTGLGLAISKKIIEAHLGQLRIDSTGELFSVYITIPMNDGQTDNEYTDS